MTFAMETMAKEEAEGSSFVHRAVQGGHRRGVPARDRSVDQIAKDFDLTETAVREWPKQAAWT
jgi:hypothetical protein